MGLLDPCTSDVCTVGLYREWDMPAWLDAIGATLEWLHGLGEMENITFYGSANIICQLSQHLHASLGCLQILQS